MDRVRHGAKLRDGSGDMRSLFYILLMVASAALTSGAHAAPTSPSFACKPSNSTVERMICADPQLAAHDRLMARLYVLARVSAFGRGPSNQAAVQRRWLRSRDGCATSLSKKGFDSKFTADCLNGIYAERNEGLAIAILFGNPDIALPEIRRLDTKAAGMLEAIYLYARSPRLSVADRERVIALLEPYASKTGDGEVDWGEPRPADAVKSDSAMGDFIGIGSAFLDTGTREAAAFPCAAFIRKPGLLEATGPHFGSNMDNFVIQSDCEETLPPLPKFSSLVRKRMDGMTDCGGGTIRFAYYRSFNNAALAARLATGTQLRNKPVNPFPRRRNVSSADTSAAVAELAAYYVRYRRANEAQARPLARQMILAMLEEAWEC
jgi:hypothetical protein